MSKLLTNQISNYNDNGPVEVKDGINVANGKPLQVAGVAGTSGDYLKSTGSSVVWTTFPTIPAAQVNSDWNATSGIAQISNKPTLATVATTGQYSDLSGLPSIPSAQIQSDWNISNTSSVDFIKNKPTLFSGVYNDLTGKPTIPSSLSQLDNVSTTAPNNNEVLKWNGSNWAPSATGAGGSTTFTGLTDTPANFTSQAGKYLKVNAGATALEYVTLPVDPNTQLTTEQVQDIVGAMFTGNTETRITATYEDGDGTIDLVVDDQSTDNNTTYSQSSVADGSNVKLRLTDSGSTDDDILVTAGNNISISSVTAGGFTIAATDTDTDTFIGLTDTPSSLTGAATKTVVVNSAGNALEFVDSGTSSNEIIPVAFAYLTANTAGTGTGISWGAYNSSNNRIEFTFATAQPDANYFVLWAREQYAQHEITVTNKTTTGFRTTWTNNDGSDLPPGTFGGGLVVYASTPTRSVGAGAGTGTGAVINNNADNRIITGSATTGELNAESSLSYDGNALSFSDDKAIKFGSNLRMQMYTDGSINYIKSSTDGSGAFPISIHSGSSEVINIDDGNTQIKTGLKDKDGDLGTAGQVLSSTGTQVNWVNAPATLGSRITYTATTASLANNAAGNVSVVAFKSYTLLKIKPSIAAWVVLYVDAASRTADASRTQGADPAPDSGVIAEVVTTGANQEIKMSPGVLGWHQDASNVGVNTVFCKVVNLSGSTGTCTVSLTVVQLEA